MASVISKETADEFINFIKEYEPYPLNIWDSFILDGKQYDDARLTATQALKCLLNAGYSEDEVNPWKKTR